MSKKAVTSSLVLALSLAVAPLGAQEEQALIEPTLWTLFGDRAGLGYNEGGLAREASPRYVHGLTWDHTGGLFGNFYGTSTIRRIDPHDGTISTIAGTPFTYPNAEDGNGDGGTAGQARIAYSSGSSYRMTFGPDGSLYFADLNRIRRIWPLPDGTIGPDSLITTAINVTTARALNRSFTCNGDARVIEPGRPKGIAVDDQGNLYFNTKYVVFRAKAKDLDSPVSGEHIQLTVAAGSPWGWGSSTCDRPCYDYWDLKRGTGQYPRPAYCAEFSNKWQARDIAFTAGSPLADGGQLFLIYGENIGVLHEADDPFFDEVRPLSIRDGSEWDPRFTKRPDSTSFYYSSLNSVRVAPDGALLLGERRWGGRVILIDTDGSITRLGGWGTRTGGERPAGRQRACPRCQPKRALLGNFSRQPTTHRHRQPEQVHL